MENVAEFAVKMLWPVIRPLGVALVAYFSKELFHRINRGFRKAHKRSLKPGQVCECCGQVYQGAIAGLDGSQSRQ